MRRLIPFTALLAASMASSPLAADEPLKVGFIYVGPVGDYGWSYMHDQGRQALDEHFGDAVETTYVEDVSEGADAQRTIRQLADAGHDVIFSTSFGFMNATARVAERYPDKTFLHATGYRRADNLGTYLSVTYEGRYVTGTAAGLVTETDTIGYIASFPIPEVIRDINATFMAAREVNPDVEMRVVWLDTWFDPPRESDAANTLIDQGVDVIVQHTDSPAAMSTAEDRGVWAVGQASDMSEFGPSAHLLSVVNDWSPYYIDTVEAVMDGNWESEDYWGGMEEGVIQIKGLSDRLDDDQRSRVEEVITAIEHGDLHPFEGPIRDQSGELRVEEGEVMSRDELASMDWYVEGMTSRLPD